MTCFSRWASAPLGTTSKKLPLFGMAISPVTEGRRAGITTDKHGLDEPRYEGAYDVDRRRLNVGPALLAFAKQAPSVIGQAADSLVDLVPEGQADRRAGRVGAKGESPV
jgi:hypothetical protein